MFSYCSGLGGGVIEQWMGGAFVSLRSVIAVDWGGGGVIAVDGGDFVSLHSVIAVDWGGEV